MSFQQSYFISYSQFNTHYKLIKHITQSKTHSIYGQHYLYLHLPSKQKVFVKEIEWENEQQLNYIIEEIKQISQYNKYEGICRFIGLCIMVNTNMKNGNLNLNNMNVNNKKVQLQKSGRIYILYEHIKSLLQIVRQLTIRSNNQSNSPLCETKGGLSPCKYRQMKQQPDYISQKSLMSILEQSIRFIQLLSVQQIDSIKVLNLQMIRVGNYNSVEQRVKYLMYAFMQNDMIQMIKQNRINIEDVFIGENVLQLINEQEQNSISKRYKNSNNKDENEFRQIQIQELKLKSPTFNTNNDNNGTDIFNNNNNNNYKSKSNNNNNNHNNTNKNVFVAVNNNQQNNTRSNNHQIHNTNNYQLNYLNYNITQQNNFINHNHNNNQNHNYNYNNNNYNNSCNNSHNNNYSNNHNNNNNNLPFSTHLKTTKPNIQIQLLQSIGLLIYKLMLLSINKYKYLQSKLYIMNTQFKLTLNYNLIRQNLSQIQFNHKYTQPFIHKISLLIFSIHQFNSLQLLKHKLFNTQPINSQIKFNIKQNKLTQQNNQLVSQNPDHPNQYYRSNQNPIYQSHHFNLSHHPTKLHSLNINNPDSKSNHNNKQNPQNKSIQKSLSNKSLSKPKPQLSQKHSINQITPSKKIPIQPSKLSNKPSNKSKIQLNQFLKQNKIVVNPYSKSKQSKDKYKSKDKLNHSHIAHSHQPSNSYSQSHNHSIHFDKSLDVIIHQPQQFNPNIASKNASPSKKPITIQKPISIEKPLSIQKSFSNSKSFPASNLSQNIIQKLKAKILYDKNGQLFPNMIQKKFRDGSTYYGQYNPKLNIKQGNGLYFYFQGDVYGGTWKNDQLNGLGIYYFANGDSYQGQVINGQKFGFGVYHYSNGNLYQGFWKNDKKSGQGQMNYANGDSYYGNFVDGRKQGHGVHKWSNGDIYQGSFIKNLKHGKGIFKTSNQTVILQGMWQNDKLIDYKQGKIIYKNLNKVYQGQIRQNGVIEGHGKLMYDQKGIYEGSFNNNNFEGRCIVNYPNGDIYKGEMNNNRYEGYGQYYYAINKKSYIGGWHEGFQQGQGKIIYHEQECIINSQWQSGRLKNMRGVIEYRNKERYQGEINQNGRHGRGKYIYSNGAWIQGNFINNQLVNIYGISE